MVAKRGWTKCMKSKANTVLPQAAAGRYPNMRFKSRYSAGSISTPNSVPMNRQPKGVMPNSRMPTDKMALPKGGWVIS